MSQGYEDGQQVAAFLKGLLDNSDIGFSTENLSGIAATYINVKMHGHEATPLDPKYLEVLERMAEAHEGMAEVHEEHA